MKLISSSTALRRTANAPLRSLGGAQIPAPVRRIAPKPNPCTAISPPSETSPATLAESCFLFTNDLPTFPLVCVTSLSHEALAACVSERPRPFGVQAGFHFGEDRTKNYALWNERVAADIEDDVRDEGCLVF